MIVAFRFIRNVTVLIVACTLIYLGTPRLLSAFVTLPAGPVLNAIQNNKMVEKESLVILIDSLKRGLELNETARRWTDLGLAQILLANRKNIQQRQIVLLRDAKTSLTKGLSMGPANAFAWTRLAYIDLALNGLSPTVSKKLKMALIRAPYDRRLLLARLELCFRAWPMLDKATKAVILNQIRFAWYADRRKMVSLAIRLGRTNLVQAALFTIPGSIIKFKTIIKRQGRTK